MECWFGCRVLPVARHIGGAVVAAVSVKTHLRGAVGVVASMCGAATIETLGVQHLRFLGRQKFWGKLLQTVGRRSGAGFWRGVQVSASWRLLYLSHIRSKDMALLR